MILNDFFQKNDELLNRYYEENKNQLKEEAIQYVFDYGIDKAGELRQHYPN